MRAILLIPIIILIAVSVAGFFITLQRPETKSYTVTATDFAFKVNGGEPRIALRVGEEVRIIFENKGSHDHEFLLVKDLEHWLEEIEERLEAGASDAELDKLKAEIAYQGIRYESEPGGSSIFRLRINEPGKFYFVCLETEPDDVPHAKKGQVGVIIVE